MTYAPTRNSNVEAYINPNPNLNPILTGGGQFDPPPCTKSVTVSRPPLIATRFFMTFFFQVLRIF